MELEKLTMEELIAYEKAAELVRHKYEDLGNVYRGVRVDENDPRFPECNRILSSFSRYNSIHNKIIEEMEKHLSEIHF